MKRIFLLFLIIVLIFTSCVSCGKEPEEPIKLTEENINDYVSIDLTFGELAITDVEGYGDSKQTLLSCLCTITVIPNADYKFENAYIYYQVKDTGEWNVITTHIAEEKIDKSTRSILPLLDERSVKLHLDKNGYGSDSFYVWQKLSSTHINFNGRNHHPAQLTWKYNIESVSGTVLKNAAQ